MKLEKYNKLFVIVNAVIIIFIITLILSLCIKLTDIMHLIINTGLFLWVPFALIGSHIAVCNLNDYKKEFYIMQIIIDVLLVGIIHFCLLTNNENYIFKLDLVNYIYIIIILASMFTGYLVNQLSDEYKVY